MQPLPQLSIMQRRSSQRTSRKTYTTDAFDAIPELRSASQSPAASVSDDDSDDADEFDAAAAEAQELSDEAEDLDDGDADLAADEDDVDEDDDSVTPGAKRHGSASKWKKCRAAAKPSASRTELTRRIVDAYKFHQYVHKAAKRNLYFGNDVRDQTSVSEVFEKWASQPVLPSRSTPFHAPHVVDPEYQTQLDNDWTWLSSGVLSRQVTTQQTLEVVRHLLPRSDRAVLIGAVQSPRRFNMPPQTSLNIDETRPGRGHIINAGGRIQCLEWVPFESGDAQHIVIATSTASVGTPFSATRAPAYTPTDSFQTVLQVWGTMTLEDHPKASLRMILSFSHGQCRRMQFCPYAMSMVEQTPRILAMIFSDGGLRVYKLPDIGQDHDVQVYHLSKPLMEIIPPDTVFSCLTWIGSSRIAAGCANGFMAVFDLADLSSTSNIRPRKYAGVATTYMLEISSCAPSCQNLVATTAMDGYIRVTDVSQTNIAAPSATVQSARVRTSLIGCLWHDYVRSIILADDSFAVRLHLIRRLFNLVTTGRTKATPTALALSQWHPFLLVGTADGTVQSLNPILKLVEIKTPIWQQIWFMHEWRRPTEQERRDVGNTDNQVIAQSGLVRFSEGYKPTPTVLQRKAGKTEPGMPGDVTTNTVYERESAVTILRWNPNQSTAGWAAAGMADGLVRLEDISLP